MLQTHFAYKDAVDTAGDTPWEGDRWNVRFMQKLDRMFNDANDQGMYLFVNGLVDLVWDRGITSYDRLVEMIGARYAAHYVSFASSMGDPYDPLHEQINAAIRRSPLQERRGLHRFGAVCTQSFSVTSVSDKRPDTVGQPPSTF